VCPLVRPAEVRTAAAEDSAATVGTVSSAASAEDSAAGGGAIATGSMAAGAAAAGCSTAGGCSLRLVGTTGGAAAVAAVATGGLTTTVTGGGATTTTGRCAAIEPAGALATTGPAGGLEAMAGVTGGAATTAEAARGWGTIFRGAGRAGAAIGGSATTGALAAGTGWAGAAGTVLAFSAATTVARGTRPRRVSSSSFLLAWMALSTSPGLEICERSILGVIAWGVRDAAALWAADFAAVPRSMCARTFAASSSSSELEWVLPLARPSSANTSRICRLLTSISRARSLIRTLLIRLFSNCATHGP